MIKFILHKHFMNVKTFAFLVLQVIFSLEGTVKIPNIVS